MRNASSKWWTTSSGGKTSVFSDFRNLYSEERFWKDAFSVTVFTGNVWRVGQTVGKNLRLQMRKDRCGRSPAVCQLKSEWFPSYLLILRKKNKNCFHHTSEESQCIQHFRIDHNVLYLSPKVCVTIVFDFSWDDYNTQEKLEYQILGDKQGALFVHVKMRNIGVAISSNNGTLAPFSVRPMVSCVSRLAVKQILSNGWSRKHFFRSLWARFQAAYLH